MGLHLRLKADVHAVPTLYVMAVSVKRASHQEFKLLSTDLTDEKPIKRRVEKAGTKICQ